LPFWIELSPPMTWTYLVFGCTLLRPIDAVFGPLPVRANWRIIWRFEGTDAADVQLIDYH
jgi:hypothetical protein